MSSPTYRHEAHAARGPLAVSQQLHASWVRDALTRRRLLQIGGLGMMGLSLPKLLSANPATQSDDRPSGPRPRAKSVIFLFQWGGPSQLDTFDMKPAAPDTVRSPYKAIASNVPGIQVCEHLPRMAQRMDRICQVRTLHHTMNNHASAGYYAISGHAPPTDDQRLRDSLDLFPAYGSVVDRLAPNDNGMPTFVAYPYVIRDGSVVPGQHASFLGKRHDPFFFREDPNADNFSLPELSLPAGLNAGRLERRRELQQLIDAQTRRLDGGTGAGGLGQYYDRAVDMLTSARVRAAFDLAAEPTALRDRYGRTTYGQSCLLARRLVESGVKVVTVYFSDTIGGQSTESGGWDTHGFNDTRMYKIVDKYHLPMTNQTLPALLDDLEQRGLLDETLVVWVGEFGRTPNINKNESRDHWPQCYTALLAGAGVQGGAIYGESDAHAAAPAAHPVRPDDLAATIFYILGIDPATEIYDTANRPLAIAAGEPIHDILT